MSRMQNAIAFISHSACAIGLHGNVKIASGKGHTLMEVDLWDFYVVLTKSNVADDFAATEFILECLQ